MPDRVAPLGLRHYLSPPSRGFTPGYYRTPRWGDQNPSAVVTLTDVEDRGNAAVSSSSLGAARDDCTIDEITPEGRYPHGFARAAPRPDGPDRPALGVPVAAAAPGAGHRR